MDLAPVRALWGGMCALSHTLIFTLSCHWLTSNVNLTMSSGYGFYKLTMWVCGTWYTGAQVDSTFRFMVFRLWKVITDSQMPSVRLSWFRLLLCTQFMVDALIQLSWILLRLFSTSYMSILHTVHDGLVLHSSGLALLSWLFPKHFCTGSTNTIVDFVKLVTTIPQRWSSIGSYPMGEFAFVIGSWNILTSTIYIYLYLDYGLLLHP